MPIYEYQCQDCQAEFEMIRSIKDADSELTCVRCQGVHIRRKLSLFNASSGGRSITSGNSCSGCSGGSCNTCGSR